MTLGSSERLLKVYNYCSGSAKDGNDTQPQGYSLTVTNKRIIIGEDTISGKCATEIRTADVKSVSYGIKVVRKAGLLSTFITMLVLSVVLIALLIFFGSYHPVLKIALIVGAVVTFIVGIVFVVLWRIKRESAFYLLFYVTDEYRLAAQVVATTNKLSFNKLDSTCISVYMHVNPLVAQCMVDEIGSIIVDCQSGRA